MVAMRERPEPEQRTAKARILMVIGALPNAKMWADIAAGRAPGRDYDALRKALDADAVYPNDLQTSLLLKLALTRPGHPRLIVLAHYLSPFKKRIWFRLGVGRHIDRLIVHASTQQ